MPPSSGRQTSSTNRPPNEIDSNSNSNSNFNSNQNIVSRSSQAPQRASSTSTSTSNSPVPQNSIQTPTSPQLQHGYYSPSHSYSHSHLHQHSHTHPGMHGMSMGMIQSVPPGGGAVPMSIGPIPGAPFYYHHPYSLYSPHTHPPPSHSHHGPPPPHPPAPPAPPRTSRSNSSGNNASTSTNEETTRSHLNTTSTSNPSRTLQLQSSFPASDDTTRPQLVPTFSYYRNQTNYDKQHRGLLGTSSQSEGRRKGKQTASALHTTHNTSLGAVDHHAGFENDNEDGDDDEDDDNNNDNDNDMMDYDEPIPMDTVDDLGIGLDLDPALVPASSVVPSSSSSDPNTIFHRTEKRANHEYYPSPHHQAHFRELMMANPSTPLSDPPISLNSLVDSEPGKKPAYPLPTIIRCAILGSPRQQLTLSELYLAMQRRFSYYTIGDGKSWRNSVRHNLSLNNLFQKVMRPITEPGKGCYWVVAHDKPPGNKRERKRNKKLGKRALAALEREKAAAAATATGDGSGDDEGDDDEDDDNSGGIEKSTLLPSSSSGLSRRGKTALRLPIPNTAPFPPYPSTSVVSQAATTSPTVLASTTTTTTRPLFPFSRGTVAPNEGSYAAVTGVVPMPSQVPLPPNFGARGYNTNTEFGVDTTTTTSQGTTTGGPFSAFATAANTMTTFGSSFGGASTGFDNSPNNGNTNPPTVISTWSANRASSSSANNKGRKNTKSSSTNGRVVPIPISERGGNGGKGGGTMSQRSSTQNQDSGSGSMNLSQTGSSQGLGSASETTLTQATSIQSSQSQGLGRVSTPLLSRAASPHPSSLLPLPSSTAPFLRQQTLSAQSSFSSAGVSVPESVSSSEQQQQQQQQQRPNHQGFNPHLITRQNPVSRRFDSGGSGSTTSNSPSISNPSLPPPLPLTLNAPNRPRDTFNTLAAQIASEFQTPDDNTTTAGVRTRTDIGSRPTSNFTSRGSRSTTTRPPRKKRATLRRNSGSDDESGSERSQEDAEESDEDDGDEYVPSGPGRRSGRRR